MRGLLSGLVYTQGVTIALKYDQVFSSVVLDTLYFNLPSAVMLRENDFNE